MELFIILALVIVAVFVIYKMMFKAEPLVTTPVTSTPSAQPAEAPIKEQNILDVNHDGKVDLADVKEVVKKTRTRAKKALDQDGDGKITTKDVKIAASKAKSKSQEIAAKTRGRKPASKKI